MKRDMNSPSILHSAVASVALLVSNQGSLLVLLIRDFSRPRLSVAHYSEQSSRASAAGDPHGALGDEASTVHYSLVCEEITDECSH
jgi:hypothetical protein